MTERPYVNGDLHGTLVRRDDDGNVIERIRYVGGERQPDPKRR